MRAPNALSLDGYRYRSMQLNIGHVIYQGMQNIKVRFSYTCVAHICLGQCCMENESGVASVMHALLCFS